MLRFSQPIADPEDRHWPFKYSDLVDRSQDPQMAELGTVQRTPWSFSVDFRDYGIFRDNDNHFVADYLEHNGVIPEGAVLDTESAMFHIYFPTQEMGLTFLGRLNLFMGKHAGLGNDATDYAESISEDVGEEMGFGAVITDEGVHGPGSGEFKLLSGPEKGQETAYDLTENVDDPKYMDAVLDALKATDDPDERAVLETRLRMMSERMRERENGGLINESNLRRFKGRTLRFAQWKKGDPALEAEARKVQPVILDKPPEEKEVPGVSHPEVDDFLRSIDITDLYAMSRRALRIIAKKTLHVQQLIDVLMQDGIFTEDKKYNIGLVMEATRALQEEGITTTDLTPHRLVTKIRQLQQRGTIQ